MSRQDAVIANPWTGDYRIDALIEGPSYRWNFDPSNPSVWGQPVTVSFSFIRDPHRSANLRDQFGFQAFTMTQEAAARKIFDELEAVIGIDFKEVVEDTEVWGEIRLGNNQQSEQGTAGYAYLPNDPLAGDSSGDVYLAVGFGRGYQPGDADLETLIHEIGHALGLTHPKGDGSAPDRPEDQQQAEHRSDENTTGYTVMSYEPHPQQLHRIDWGLYDLLALRHIYGSRAFKTGNDLILMDDVKGHYQSLLIDDGGIDLLDLSNLSLGTQVNMNPGTFSSIGRMASGKAAINNLAIAHGTVIEQLKGTKFTDLIIGNAADNRIEPILGYDSIDGGPGIDTVVYQSLRKGFSASSNQARTNQTAEITVTGLGFLNRLNEQKLTNVERIEFSDVSLAFDLNGNAGLALKTIALLYGIGQPSTQLCGLAIRHIDEKSRQFAELPEVIAHDLLQFDGFWGIEAKRNNQTMINLIASRLKLISPDSTISDADLTKIEDQIAVLGGAEKFLAELIKHPALNELIGIPTYFEYGLPWV